MLLLNFFKDMKREIASLNENWKTNQNQVEILWFNARINE